MKNDPSSNYDIVDVLDAKSRTAGTVYTAAVDLVTADCTAFLISCGTWDTSFEATLQYSDDNSAWTDEPDTEAGNTVSATLTEAGSALIKVPNPRARYSRLKVVLGGTCVASVTAVSGPLLSVDAPDAA
ncbi:MAG: hypothetical protein DRO88_02545 [Promethearchaeia archaeon]|nr:MAG: hypothetical protein DRO88_02545 [Candidatus Lokiarchaeia archaeon]